jgi:hypothetical protein
MKSNKRKESKHFEEGNVRKLAGKKDVTDDAREEAMGDLSIKSSNDDLDEGETARLGEDKTELA